MKASSATRNIKCLIICSILVGTYVTYDLAIRGRNCVWNGPDWSRGLWAAPEAGEFLTVGRSKRVDWQFGGGPETERCMVWCGLSSLLCCVLHVFYFSKSIFFLWFTLHYSILKSQRAVFSLCILVGQRDIWCFRPGRAGYKACISAASRNYS